MTPAVIAAVVLIADQLSKAWVLRTWPQPYTGEIPIIDRWLELTYIQNTGVAFGLFGGVPQLFTVTSLIIVGGAIGNVVDRVRFGYVVDFVKTFDGRFPVFNVADSCVVVGVGLMAIFFVAVEEHPPAQQLAPPVEADDGR